MLVGGMEVTASKISASIVGENFDGNLVDDFERCSGFLFETGYPCLDGYLGQNSIFPARRPFRSLRGIFCNPESV